VTVPDILLPVFVQVALTFFLLFWMGGVRFRAVKAGEVDTERALYDKSAWPAKAAQAGNSFVNQFEIPVLFYVVVALALFTRQADFVSVVLSWIFVLSRIVHAIVHVTSNNIGLRFPAYMVGVIALIAMWVIFALGILVSPVLP